MSKIKVWGYSCERCSHIWVPRSEREPTVCPKCKSPYWDRPVERKSVSDAKRLKKGK